MMLMLARRLEDKASKKIERNLYGIVSSLLYIGAYGYKKKKGNKHAFHFEA